MPGGIGNDRYYVDSGGDEVTELAGQGIDLHLHRYPYLNLVANIETCAARHRQSGAGNAGNPRQRGNNALGLAGTTLTGQENCSSGPATMRARRHLWRGGNDTLDGGDGNDQLDGLTATTAWTAARATTVLGSAGNDTLLGGDGDDSVRRAGNDVLDGGAGVNSSSAARATTSMS